MKIRTGLVSNSSSTSYIITNFATEARTLVDFVRESPGLLGAFKAEYTDDHRMTQEQMLLDAKAMGITFAPGESKECVFGDEDGTTIGDVYDYMLRTGGSSRSFSWRFHKWMR